MLQSRGISQICHTYSEDMHLHTPRLRFGVTMVAENIWVHILLLGAVYPILVTFVFLWEHDIIHVPTTLNTAACIPVLFSSREREWFPV